MAKYTAYDGWCVQQCVVRFVFVIGETVVAALSLLTEWENQIFVPIPFRENKNGET